MSPVGFTVLCGNSMRGTSHFVGTWPTEEEAMAYCVLEGSRTRDFASFEVWTGSPKTPGKGTGKGVRLPKRNPPEGTRLYDDTKRAYREREAARKAKQAAQKNPGEGARHLDLAIRKIVNGWEQGLPVDQVADGLPDVGTVTWSDLAARTSGAGTARGTLPERYVRDVFEAAAGNDHDRYVDNPMSQDRYEVVDIDTDMVVGHVTGTWMGDAQQKAVAIHGANVLVFVETKGRPTPVGSPRWGGWVGWAGRPTPIAGVGSKLYTVIIDETGETLGRVRASNQRDAYQLAVQEFCNLETSLAKYGRSTNKRDISVYLPTPKDRYEIVDNDTKLVVGHVEDIWAVGAQKQAEQRFGSNVTAWAESAKRNAVGEPGWIGRMGKGKKNPGGDAVGLCLVGQDREGDTYAIKVDDDMDFEARVLELEEAMQLDKPGRYHAWYVRTDDPGWAGVAPPAERFGRFTFRSPVTTVNPAVKDYPHGMKVGKLSDRDVGDDAKPFHLMRGASSYCGVMCRWVRDPADVAGAIEHGIDVCDRCYDIWAQNP